jgi:hypothetical protein
MNTETIEARARADRAVLSVDLTQADLFVIAVALSMSANRMDLLDCQEMVTEFRGVLDKLREMLVQMGATE